MYVNVGAKVTTDASDIPTKAALKRLLRETPGKVALYVTSAVGTSTTGDNLTVGVKYSVVGPNPYTSRKWYATVEKLPNGTIRVR